MWETTQPADNSTKTFYFNIFFLGFIFVVVLFIVVVFVVVVPVVVVVINIHKYYIQWLKGNNNCNTQNVGQWYIWTFEDKGIPWT